MESSSVETTGAELASAATFALSVTMLDTGLWNVRLASRYQPLGVRLMSLEKADRHIIHPTADSLYE